MGLAPIAVFAAMAATVTTQGIGILVTYGKYLIMFYFSLGVLWLVLIAAGFLFLGRAVFRLISLIREPLPVRLQYGEQRGRLPGHDGAARKAPGQQEDHQLCVADGLLVQPRRLDDVLHPCG